eukprot:gnl/MRDRNA2_/MRDRNA2_76173_c0_seq1.p1 gnl/MRDRNA2_/MRDRNA2_76173_c0~~gnl/MRDRNA2_/MRDRNA2_76173_c0_seq1.p1  ORF type:complete len:369 (+),score=58.79 gnl/MRDRNA2_/MRDRNA2_76173_c0_seq1:125-1108(+)
MTWTGIIVMIILSLGLIVLSFQSALACISCASIWVLDGSIRARLAIWGLVSESHAFMSISSACALLQLKQEPTPYIELHRCLADKDAAKFGEAIRVHTKSAKTQVVAIHSCKRLTMKGVSVFCKEALCKTSQVRELDLSGNPQLGDEVATVLAPFIDGGGGIQLRDLRLGYCSLTPKGACVIGTAASSSILNLIDLSWNDLQGAGKPLATLVDSPMLQELRLIGCGLIDDDIKELAAEIGTSSIQILELAANSLGDGALEALAENMGSSQLKHLSLAKNKISKGNAFGRLAVAWAAQYRKGGSLDIGGNNLTQEDMELFKMLLNSAS